MGNKYNNYLSPIIHYYSLVLSIISFLNKMLIILVIHTIYYNK